MDDSKMKPLLIIANGEISKRDVNRLNKNGFCVVEAKDPSKVRFSEPPPLSYDHHDRAAIELFRYVMKQSPATSWTKRELATLYVELLLNGIRPIPVAPVERIPKQKVG